MSGAQFVKTAIFLPHLKMLKFARIESVQKVWAGAYVENLGRSAFLNKLKIMIHIIIAI